MIDFDYWCEHKMMFEYTFMCVLCMFGCCYSNEIKRWNNFVEIEDLISKMVRYLFCVSWLWYCKCLWVSVWCGVRCTSGVCALVSLYYYLDWLILILIWSIGVFCVASDCVVFRWNFLQSATCTHILNDHHQTSNIKQSSVVCLNHHPVCLLFIFCWLFFFSLLSLLSIVNF